MPVITLDRDRFCRFLKREISVKEMARWLPWLGLDIEDVGENYVKVEFNPNRIDFCSHAGLARAFKGLRGWETGMPTYETKEGNIVIKVDPSVSKVRPYVLGAVIRNLKLDEEDVRELMEMQEDLHWGLGRDRRKASIGIHNLDNIEPPFLYTTGEPDEVRFVPLGMKEEMSMREILERHEKGIAYRHLIEWSPRYPVILDNLGRVLSMPPIINGELTRVDSQTENLFIDITGTSMEAVNKSLNVLVTALSDMGGTIETITVKYPNQTLTSPNLSPQKSTLRMNYARKMLGLNLSEAETIKCLKKCRLDVKSVGKGVLEVLIPPYRIDILHEIDLVEEVALGYGYYRLKPTIPPTITSGQRHILSELANHVRQIMIGLGFTEVVNFILTTEDIQYRRMRRRAKELIKLANPVSAECSIARESLLPGIMRNLMDNKHEKYPQRIFEVSDVIKINERMETRTERRLHLAAASAHASANFTEIKSYLEALLTNLGLRDWNVKETRDPSFIPGRAAAIYVGKRKIGIVGEIHPEVLNNFELENPVGAFEIDLQRIRLKKEI